MGFWDPETPPSEDECRAAAYRLSHAFAAAELRRGLCPDAVRAAAQWAEELEEGPASPGMREAKWRGIEDALAGRPMSDTA